MSQEIIDEVYRLRTKLAKHSSSSNTIHSMTLDPIIYDNLLNTLFAHRFSIAPWGDWKVDTSVNTITLFGIKVLKGER